MIRKKPFFSLQIILNWSKRIPDQIDWIAVFFGIVYSICLENFEISMQNKQLTHVFIKLLNLNLIIAHTFVLKSHFNQVILDRIIVFFYYFISKLCLDQKSKKKIQFFLTFAIHFIGPIGCICKQYITIIWCNNTPDTLSQYTKTIIVLLVRNYREKATKKNSLNGMR